MVQSCEDLDVFKRSYQAALDIHKLTLQFPKIEQYALADQLRRSSKGICANIAEGFAKSHKSPAEFKRFCLIAIGSSEETIVWLKFARDLDYIDNDVHKQLSDGYKITCKQLNTMIDKWKS